MIYNIIFVYFNVLVVVMGQFSVSQLDVSLLEIEFFFSTGFISSSGKHLGFLFVMKLANIFLLNLQLDHEERIVLCAKLSVRCRSK